MNCNAGIYTKEQLKLLVLQEMHEKTDLLFGGTAGYTSTKTEFSDALKKVVSLALASGLVNEGDVNMFRKETWQNWCRNVITKVERMKRATVGGAITDILDESDKLLLEIVGNEILYGVDVCERDGRNDVVTGVEDKTQEHIDEEEMLRGELLKICFYCKQLECREREVRLGLKVSKFTSSLFVSSQSSHKEGK